LADPPVVVAAISSGCAAGGDRHRRREVDVSPWIQKIGTRIRAFLPTLIDKRIYAKTATIRTAFNSVPELAENS
jgi:11beta/17beta-hydroxysteroid dehydrogenase